MDAKFKVGQLWICDIDDYSIILIINVKFSGCVYLLGYDGQRLFDTTDFLLDYYRLFCDINEMFCD